MITLGQLSTPLTADEATDTILEFLEGLGFAATSWQEGSIVRTILTGVGWLYSGITQVVADQAASHYPRLARDQYQDLLGERVYDLPRVAATATEGTMQFALSAAAAPATWADGELVIADKEVGEDGANTYRPEGASMLPGEIVSLTAVAESAGAAANIPNDTPLFLWTPITGLSVTNPAPSGSTTWITSEGQDQESQARFGDRMVARWSRLSYGNIEGAYRAWAFEALPALTRVRVSQGAAEGEVLIVGATATGTLTAPQIDTISDYIHGVTDGVGRRPINDTVTVQGATTKTTPALALTVRCDSALAGDAASRVTEALSEMFGALPIGGEKLSPDPSGYVFAARIYETVMAEDGVRNVTGVPADILLGATEIYAPTIAVTVIAT